MAAKLSRSAEFLPRLGKDGRNGAPETDDDGAPLSPDSGTELKTAAARLEKWHKLTDVGNRLTQLDLSGCALSGSLAPGVAELYNRQKQNMKRIVLQDNPTLGPEAVKYLLVAFENSRTLQYLNLRNTGVTDECISALIKSFSVLPSLSDISLADNSITEAGAELFGAFLQTNTTLTGVSLAQNKLKDTGAVALSRALEVNTTLRTLELSTCRIADAGAVQLSLMLAVNSTLTRVDLSRNPITEDGVEAFADVIQKNTTLLQVSMTGVERIYLERIAQICRRNKTFVGELVPHKLDKEMQRLYVQQHKLEVANEQLRELHVETARIQEQVKNIDLEFEVEKQDINAKAKKVVEVMDYTTLTIQDLQRKYKDLQAQAQRERDTKEAEVEATNERLDVTTREREVLEARADELQAQYQKLVDERQAKVETFQKHIADCQAEQEAAIAERKATLEKIAEISQMVK